MLLRPEHFAALRINWQDKASSLRELAKELNIGIDAIAFLDDNPVEREWVSAQVPEVTVIDLPNDPMLFAKALREAPMFERLELSEEDRMRGRMYAEQRMRADLQEAAGSLEDFYRSLAMKGRWKHPSSQRVRPSDQQERVRVSGGCAFRPVEARLCYRFACNLALSR